MRKYIKIFIFLSIIFSLFSEKLPMLTVYYFERPPFFSDDGGFLLDISKRIFEESGIEYKFEKVPVKRIFENLKIMDNSCVIGALKTVERSLDYTYSNDYIYRDGSMRIIIRKDKSKGIGNSVSISNLLKTSMKGAVIDGYSYGEWLDKFIRSNTKYIEKINIGNEADRMFKMIEAGRVDYTFGGLEESLYAIKKNKNYKKNIDIVEILEAPEGNERYILFNKNTDKRIIDKINYSIEKVKKNKEYLKFISEVKEGNYR